MSFDCSRFTFQPWKDLFGVVMQQGRVQLDSDWNEWVAQVSRRLQAGTIDMLSRNTTTDAIVPRATPLGFQILATGGVLSIGAGRAYVDGLLVENHGGTPTQWDTRLVELAGTAATPFFEQPYLPFNAANQPAPQDVFNRPAIPAGPVLVYLDVWQRALTYLQEPDLVEKAVGVDTTARLQTVWQVKLLPGIGTATCTTPDGEVSGWSDLIRPSGARLTNSTGVVPGDVNPCLTPPAAGYTGLENQLYRVEIHKGGPRASATFKWSRDNATVTTRVTEIQGLHVLVVESIGRDDVLGFHVGEWIEILDDWHELHGLPGLLRRIRPGDGVDSATRSITLEDALPAGLFPVDAQGRTVAVRNTRIRRWDQSGAVRRADGSSFVDLNLSASSDGIPIPPAGTQLVLESGILVQFDLEAGGEFKSGDYWVFAARAADGSIEPLDHAPPRGIHHHYARLAVVTLPDTESDCRVLWPPEDAAGEICDCTECVHVEAHNAGTGTIQQAIDRIRTRRGGTLCLDVGIYILREKLNLEGVVSLRIRGQGLSTVLQLGMPGTGIDILQAVGVTVENLSILGSAHSVDDGAMIAVNNCAGVRLSRIFVLALSPGDAQSASVSLTRVLLGGEISDCVFLSDIGVTTPQAGKGYLLTAQVRMRDNAFLCSRNGVSLDGLSLHFGELRISDNLMFACSDAGVSLTGAAFPAASATVSDNVFQVTGTGIRAGTSGLRAGDNDIVGCHADQSGIAIVPGLDKAPMDRVQIVGNRLSLLAGDGISIERSLAHAIVKNNMFNTIVGQAFAMKAGASSAWLSVENNQFAVIGPSANSEDPTYFAMNLLAVRRGDVAGNVFEEIAREALPNRLRGVLLVEGCGELRVAENRMFGIGPARAFAGQAKAVMADVSFSRLAVESNSISRAAESAAVDKTESANWQAIAIGAREPGTFSPGKSGYVFLPLADKLLFLSLFGIKLLSAPQPQLLVGANGIKGQESTALLVEIANVATCLFDRNQADQQNTPQAQAPPVARIQCDQLNVSNNRLIGPGSDLDAALLGGKAVIVIGNHSAGVIRLNGNPLPPPWAPLNMQV